MLNCIYIDSMKLSNKKVSLIILFISIALGGLIVLQTVLLKSAMKAEEETFRNSINLVLTNVVKDLTANEARNTVLSIVYDNSSHIGSKITQKQKFNSDSSHALGYFMQQKIDTTIDSSSNLYQYTFQEERMGKKISLDSTLYRYELAMVIDDSSASHYHGIEFYHDSIPLSRNNLDSARVLLVETAISELENLEIIPIENRINKATLDSAIQTSLQKINIDLSYTFAVINMKLDSLIFGTENSNQRNLYNSPYRALLFPNDFMMASNYLVVDFPDKQFYIYSKLFNLIILTIIFIIIIIGCFIYSLKLILSQRRTANRLTEFINNMTHEFKTPISTIQLAASAITKPENINQTEMIQKYNKMILAENNRMKTHVDKILQIATLEEGDYIFSFERIDVHLLIQNAVESLSMVINQKNGQLVLDLKASASSINGDKVHILNMIYNIIDNALKYSKGTPELVIHTDVKGEYLNLLFKDDGIGIHPDDINLVFQKYYRVSSGDIHNIKGFGLGLSYVKMIVEAHQGTIELKSVLDKGTEVMISLPLA